MYPEEYERLVINDLKDNIGLRYPVKVGILERILTRKVSPSKLHPNPEDEFSNPAIGPNYEIVGGYVKSIKTALSRGQKPMEEPLIIEKISTGGYMLLNGHHRWMAALRIGLKRAPVQLVNVTNYDEILHKISKSNREMCVSFDFDEVLITDGSVVPKDRKINYPLNKLYKNTLRKNAPILIKELRQMGFDVWVYTGNYHSEEYIKLLMRLHGTNIDGVINGLSKSKSRKNLQEAFANKYKYSLHVDNEGITCVNTSTKDYEVLELEADVSNWASEAMIKIKCIEMLKNLNS